MNKSINTLEKHDNNTLEKQHQRYLPLYACHAPTWIYRNMGVKLLFVKSTRCQRKTTLIKDIFHKKSYKFIIYLKTKLDYT